MTYVSPEGRKLVVWLSVFTALIFSIIGLRFYVITRLNRRPLRPEDAAILVSVAALLAMEGTTFWGMFNNIIELTVSFSVSKYLTLCGAIETAIHNGLGARTETLPWPQVVATIKVSDYSSISSLPASSKIHPYQCYLPSSWCPLSGPGPSRHAPARLLSCSCTSRYFITMLFSGEWSGFW